MDKPVGLNYRLKDKINDILSIQEKGNVNETIIYGEDILETYSNKIAQDIKKIGYDYNSEMLIFRKKIRS